MAKYLEAIERSRVVLPLELQLPSWIHSVLQFLSPCSVHRYDWSKKDVQLAIEKCFEPSLSFRLHLFILYYSNFRSARVSIYCHAVSLPHDFALFLRRVRTVLLCVPLVYMDQTAYPPAPAIIMHPVLLSMAPASAGKVKHNWLCGGGSLQLLSFARYLHWV